MTMKTPVTNTRLWERKCNGRNVRMNITLYHLYIYIYLQGVKFY